MIPRMSKPATMDHDDFAAFCRQATDAQLQEILRREYAAGREADYHAARVVATERGWTVRKGQRL